MTSDTVAVRARGLRFEGDNYQTHIDITIPVEFARSNGMIDKSYLARYSKDIGCLELCESEAANQYVRRIPFKSEPGWQDLTDLDMRSTHIFIKNNPNPLINLISDGKRKRFCAKGSIENVGLINGVQTFRIKLRPQSTWTEIKVMKKGKRQSAFSLNELSTPTPTPTFSGRSAPQISLSELNADQLIAIGTHMKNGGSLSAEADGLYLITRTKI